MFETRYPVHDRTTNREGQLRVAGGIWSGDACVFEFCETASGMAGSITCDWRSQLPRIEFVEGDPNCSDAQDLVVQIRRMMRPFHSGACLDITEQELNELYNGDYHKRMNLAVEDDYEIRFKKFMLDQAVQLVPKGKVLDAGCSAGETVRQLRGRGYDAWGFDLCPDLNDIAYPEVRDVVRVGSVTNIPYDAIDGFDTLFALDLFEHIREDLVPQMVREFERLNVQYIVAHIALCEYQYPGHLTLRPMSWWDRQLAPCFRRIQPEAAGPVAGAFGADPSRQLRVYQRLAVELTP